MNGRADDRPLSGYVIRELIGSGAESEVFRAEPTGRPGTVVAVKRIRGAVDAEAVEALRREADILIDLDHPSLVTLIDIVPDGDAVALVLTYAAGGSLADRLRVGSLPAQEVADIGARIGSALAVLHDAGLIHGDIKPANVLFDAEQQPLLADLGAARLHHDRRPLVGTIDHLAPEVLAGRPPDELSDLYALGVTLREAVSDPPPALARVIDAAIDHDPTRRPATAALLAGHLDEVRRSLGVSDPAGPPPRPRPDEQARPRIDLTRPTQRFGPQPPSSTPVDAGPGRIRRTLAIAAMAVVVGVPIAIVAWLVTSVLGG